MRVLVFVCLAAGFTAPAAAQVDVPFVAGCTPMFGGGDIHPIDGDCGIEGAATAPDKKLECRTKNNYCAAGTAARLTFWSFDRLHQLTQKSAFQLAPDRGGAKAVHTTSDGVTVGEGDLAMFTGFVIRADTANKSAGETVNCGKGGTARNDVHIHVAPTPSKAKANFCRAVIAEMSPHLRPDAWNGGNLMLTDGIPVRFTGQLFYDTSHPKAECKKAAKEKAKSRTSSWELHPVYQVDVCKNTTLAACDPRDASKWIPLDDWLAEQEDEDDDGD